jgi:hypothetical protein
MIGFHLESAILINMASGDNLRKILSLSAASMALLQSSIPAKGKLPEGASVESDHSLDGQIASKTAKLILEPPLQKELLQLYADHSSHASHQSHSSHVSGMGGSSPYYAPSAPPPAKSTLKIFAAWAAILGLIFGLVQHHNALSRQPLENYKKYPNWLGWVCWIVAAAGVVILIFA